MATATDSDTYLQGVWPQYVGTWIARTGRIRSSAIRKAPKQSASDGPTNLDGEPSQLLRRDAILIRFCRSGTESSFCTIESATWDRCMLWNSPKF